MLKAFLFPQAGLGNYNFLYIGSAMLKTRHLCQLRWFFSWEESWTRESSYIKKRIHFKKARILLSGKQILFSFFRWGTWGPEKLNTLANVLLNQISDGRWFFKPSIIHVYNMTWHIIYNRLGYIKVTNSLKSQWLTSIKVFYFLPMLPHPVSRL